MRVIWMRCLSLRGRESGLVAAGKRVTLLPAMLHLVIRTLCYSTLVATAILVAVEAEERDAFGVRIDEAEDPDKDEKPWVEAIIQFPAFPREEDLKPVQMDTPGIPYRFFIDAATLEIHADGVVRYSLVMEAPSGVRNVAFEGYRCTNNTYKIYGHGTRDRSFRKPKKSDWRQTNYGRMDATRRQLGRRYLCNDLGFPYPKKEILNRIAGWGRVPIQADESYLYPGYQ